MIVRPVQTAVDGEAANSVVAEASHIGGFQSQTLIGNESVSGTVSHVGREDAASLSKSNSDI